MKQKLLLTLLLAVLTSVGIAAQDEPQTAPPVIEVVEYDKYVDFVFTCEDDVYNLDIALYLDNVFQGYVGGPFPWNMGGAKSNYSSYSIDRTDEVQYVVLHVIAWGANGQSGMIEFEYTIDPLYQNLSEQTAPPVITGRYFPETYDMDEIRFYDSYIIYLENTDVEEAMIFFRYHYTDEWDGVEYASDWNSTYGCSDSGVLGIHGSAWGWLEAYSKADGKFESDTIKFEFYCNCYPSQRYARYYDFNVDGIYYSILTNSTVAVSKHTVDNTVALDTSTGQLSFIDSPMDREPFDALQGANPCYFDDVVIPATVDYQGKTYTVTAINDYAFECCQLTSIQLPNTLTEIGKCAFYGTFLPNYTIPSTVTTIGDGAFANFYDFSALTIPETVTSIADAAFANNQISSVTIPEAVTTIGNSAFLNCYELTSVDIPGGVTTIGGFAFGNCYGLETVTCHAVTPPDCWGVFDYFDEYGVEPRVYDHAKLFVPAESETAYRDHEEWGRFYNIVPFIGAGPGDVNGDGNIGVQDVTVLIDQLINGGDVPAYCDVDGDGQVSVKDITVLIDRLLESD